MVSNFLLTKEGHMSSINYTCPKRYTQILALNIMKCVGRYIPDFYYVMHTNRCTLLARIYLVNYLFVSTIHTCMILYMIVCMFVRMFVEDIYGSIYVSMYRC